MKSLIELLIKRYQIKRLTLPAGRCIGDCGCAYNSFDVIAVCLEDDQGHAAWGYEATVSQGRFARSASWVTPMPVQREIEAAFRAWCWPVLSQLSDDEALVGVSMRSPIWALNRAVDLALWDLAAKRRGLPVWRMLRDGEPYRVPVYGSPLDYPLDEDATLALCQAFLDMGCRTLKIKVGAEAFERDARRLQVVRDAVGPAVELAVDVNEGWDLPTAIAWLPHMRALGIRLAYVEDPLPRHQIQAWAELRRAIDIPIAGCDYHDHAGELEQLLEVEAIDLLRVAGDVGHWMACAHASRRYGVPMIFGNTIFDVGMHGAMALGGQLVEYSQLACNDLLTSPPRVCDGYYEVPTTPGFGWDPCPQMLEAFANPGEEVG